MNLSHKEELLNLIKKLCSGGYTEENQLVEDINYLKFQVLDPDIIDYIFSVDYELTPEEILEKALSYKPIITPPPPPKKV